MKTRQRSASSSDLPDRPAGAWNVETVFGTRSANSLSEQAHRNRNVNSITIELDIAIPAIPHLLIRIRFMTTLTVRLSTAEYIRRSLRRTEETNLINSVERT